MRASTLAWETWSVPIARALKYPSGARFFKCALQVNPYAYVKRHKKMTKFTTEVDYNGAIVEACLDDDVEAVGVVDHHNVKSSESLRAALTQAGIVVFPGFEVTTKEGVHMLCLFDATTKVDRLERILGDCGIHEDLYDGHPAKYDVEALLAACQRWGGICIAAHAINAPGGILRELDGQTRVAAWRLPLLLAVSIPGPVKDTHESVRQILENTDAQHKRDRAVAVLNASDVNSAEDLKVASATSWIKMSTGSVDGLKQAFLDPRSRIRLSSDPEPEDHTELVAVAWEGGFLDGCVIHLNENLNVLVGGRGTGKSTIVESLRYVLGLDPLGDDAQRLHEGIIKNVLRSGTKISVILRAHRPSKREYLIERTIPNPPTVRDSSGALLNIVPSDIASGIEVYGQHEISELTKSDEKLTLLLDRFVIRDPGLHAKKRDLKRQLEHSRGRILEVNKELQLITDRLGTLPALEEALKAYQDAGLEELLKEQSLLIREEKTLQSAKERLRPFHSLLEQFRRALPIDRALLSQKALDGLPNRDVLEEADGVLQKLDGTLNKLSEQFRTALGAADTDLNRIENEWSTRKSQAQASYEKVLRDLQKLKIDGGQFVALRRQIEDLRPLRERQKLLAREQQELANQRRNLIAEWEDIKAAHYRELEQAAKRVTEQLANRVEVSVVFAGNRDPLSQLLRERLGGRLSETAQILKNLSSFSLRDFVETCRSGADALTKKFGIVSSQAQRLAQSDAATIMAMEELDLPATTTIKLNVAAEGRSANWQALDELSTGQKATAVLLLLLLESDAPLLVDQPEDDLDNRFISEGIVPKLREEKRRRQFVFATHNANLPVLGDAELIIGLTAGAGHAEIPVQYIGSIDVQSVRELIEEVLEGGKEAFETRRLKYGF